MHAKQREPRDEASAGDIVAVVGLKDSITGDTLCDPRAPDRPGAAGVPRAGHHHVHRAADQRRQEEARRGPEHRCGARTPASAIASTARPARPSSPAWASCTWRSSRTSSSATWAWTSTWASPRWPTRRRSSAPPRPRAGSSARPAAAGSTAWWSCGSSRSRPQGEEEPIVFEDDTKGGVIPREYIRRWSRACAMRPRRGPLAGYPMLNIKVTLLDGKYHPVDSSDVAFQQAGALAFHEAVAKASPVFLEPIMRLQVTHAGGIPRRGDRRPERPAGEIRRWSSAARYRVLSAEVPLAEMFGYSHAAAIADAGRATQHDGAALRTPRCRRRWPTEILQVRVSEIEKFVEKIAN